IPGWSFDRSVVERLPNLQFLQKGGTGLDWMDIQALSEHGVLVATNDGFNAAPVADHVLLMTLLCLRGVLDKVVQIRNGVWNRDQPPGGAIDLDGAPVGIVGLGKIGTHTARRFAATGANLVATGRHPRQVEGLPEIRWLALPDLLRESDVVVIS